VAVKIARVLKQLKLTLSPPNDSVFEPIEAVQTGVRLPNL
jgi:hypothetical protein